MCEAYLEWVKSAMKNVPENFWSIDTAEGIGKTYRERVYCYELYHQLRCIQERCKKCETNPRCQYDCIGQCNLNAEIDKRGHAVIKHPFNPDFVIHINGSMTNYAVIEVKVKNRRLSAKGIIKDFDTITTMMGDYHYKLGIFILTHSTMEELWHKALRKIDRHKLEKYEDGIYLIVQERAEDKIEAKLLREVLKEYIEQ